MTGSRRGSSVGHRPVISSLWPDRTSFIEAFGPLRGGPGDAMLPLLSLEPRLAKPRRDDGHVTPAIPGLGSA
jgi:hypothetical protein